ncbi:uncharacterized protein N7482_002855 [Penicillium canariense]|uniref:Uncharacterized protein n=1 Tax=Penicillium canariense TaxID=189055 RepID=A0A9W9IFZ9_9EURO|nr:uncharacterized protein N7482_002855 [Penicillium canariense]KAJ5176978.1 hypothetical protein N7482_002855 [Penicillium canariense]
MSSHERSPPSIGVKLATEDDWHQWLSTVKTIALEAQIWQYINPKNPTEPPEPIEPQRPTAATVAGNPTATVNDLSQSDLQRYQALLSIYRIERDEYDAFFHARQRLVRAILASVAQANQHYLTGLHTPYQQLLKLRTVFAPSPRLYRQQLRVTWRDQLEYTSNQHQDRQAWLIRTEALYNECLSVDVPEVKDKDALLYDFLTAIRAAGNELFFQTWYQHIFVANQDIDFYRLVHYLREAQRLEKSQASTRTGRLAMSTLNGQREARPACVCGYNHPYKRCYYLNTDARPDGWTPNQDTAESVNKRLQDDPELIKQIQKTLPGFKSVVFTTFSDVNGPIGSMSRIAM